MGLFAVSLGSTGLISVVWQQAKNSFEHPAPIQIPSFLTAKILSKR